MPVTYRFSMLLGLCLATVLGVMNPLRISGAGNDTAMLKRIASRVDGRMGVIAIEASTPVPYVASQPDPKTFVVELRDVVALGFQNEFAADPRHPFAAVQVENAAASDGTIVARVRMTLDSPMRPRVRSTRNVIYVEAERASGRANRSDGCRTCRQHQSRRRLHQPPRQQRQRHRRQSRRNDAATCSRGQLHGSVAGDSRPPHPEARRGHGRHPARHLTPDCDQRHRTEGRTASRRGQSAECDVIPADDDERRTGAGSARADRVRSEGAADDAGELRAVAHGAVSRRVVSGRQRSHAGVRRAGRRSVQRAPDAAHVRDAHRRPAGVGLRHPRHRRGNGTRRVPLSSVPLPRRLRGSAGRSGRSSSLRAQAQAPAAQPVVPVQPAIHG